MKIYVCISIILIFSTGCANSQLRNKCLDLSTLQRVERFYPSRFDFFLLDVKSNPSDLESETFLLLYNNKKVLIDSILLKGRLKKISKDTIEIYKTLSGEGGDASIGGLKINYVDILTRSKNGGIEASYLVDSIKYLQKKGLVTLFCREPIRQFVLNSSELQSRKNEFIKTIEIITNLSEIDFNSSKNDFFSITNSKKSIEGASTETKIFFLENPKIIRSFYSKILANGI